MPEKEKPTILGQLLEAYRRQTGVTLRALAKKIGIRHPTLVRVEQGKEMTGEVLSAIMRWALTERTRRGICEAEPA